MVAERRGGGGRATGLGGCFNQLLVKTEAAAECVTALTRVSGGPSAFSLLFDKGRRAGRAARHLETAEVAGSRFQRQTCLSRLMKFAGKEEEEGEGDEKHVSSGCGRCGR